MKSLKWYLFAILFVVAVVCFFACGTNSEIDSSKNSFSSVARTEEKNYRYDEFHYDASSDSVYCNYETGKDALRKLCEYGMGCEVGDLISECRKALINKENAESILYASGTVEISFNEYKVVYNLSQEETIVEEIVVYNK